MTASRRAVAAALPLALCLAASSLGGSEAAYEAVLIEPFDQQYALAQSAVTGLNDLGQVTGGASAPYPVNTQFFVWTPEGGVEVIDIEPGPINNAGVMASPYGLLFPDGTLQEFDPAFGAWDINDSLTVVGPRTICSSGSDAKAWTPELGLKSLFADYGVLAAYSSNGVNNHNEIVGARSTTDECGDLEAFYFNLDTQEHIDIHAELLGPGPGITEAFDINDAGWVIGAGPNGGAERSFLWHRDEGFTFLPSAPGAGPLDTHFEAINNAGVVVGWALTDDGSRGVIWDEANGARDLNDLVEMPGGYIFDRAWRINNEGWIIGSAHKGAWSPPRGVILIPTGGGEPEQMPADFDKDGAVDSADLNTLLGSFGCVGGACAGDVDGDGDTDSADLNLLLASFGGVAAG